jgi:hypothetical protein
MELTRSLTPCWLSPHGVSLYADVESHSALAQCAEDKKANEKKKLSN